MEVYEVEIKGVRPLLVNAPTDLSDKPKLRRGEHLDPKTEAERKLYRDSEGNIVIPSVNIKAMIRDAGANYKVKGRRTTFKAMIKAAIDIKPYPYVPLLDGDGNPNPKWVVDIRPVVVQRSRILRARPRFDEWRLKFQIINKDPTIIHEETLKKILEDAGKYYGLGDFRPEFGLFQVVTFKKTENK